MTAQPYNRFVLCRGRGVCRVMETRLKNGSIFFFLKMAKQTKRKITVDIMKKMSQHSFIELFRWNTKTPLTFAIAPTDVLITVLQYRR